MPALSIVLQEPAWPELASREADIIHISNDAVAAITGLAGGMKSGQASVTLRLDLPDGKVVLYETSLALFLAAAAALKAKYGPKDEQPKAAETGRFDYGGKRPDGQHERHPGLAPEERAPDQHVRPLRMKYKHTKCGCVTTMPRHCAETYATNPGFYGKTFCCQCGDYFPVGAAGEFTWVNEDGTDSPEKVGT